jgi:two-component system sensor histidine kinase MprB
VIRRLSLRTRLAALVCGAIGLAAVAAALSAYLLVRGQLNQEVDDQLAVQATAVMKSIQVGQAPLGPGAGTARTGTGAGTGNVGITATDGGPGPMTRGEQLIGQQPGPVGPGSGPTLVNTADCEPNPTPIANPAARPEFGIQLVKSNGMRCATPYYATPVTAADIEVAQGLLTRSLRSGYTDDGLHVRVLTVQADSGTGSSTGSGTGTGVAVSYIRPLSDVDASLGALAWRLGAVAGAGLAAAVLAGLFVARAALRPVRRFTDVVEHIARTDDLGTRVEVSGQDEIARLGVSFNDMTAALESERLRQRRLVSDAGHELRTPLTGLRTAVDLLVRSERSGRELTPAHRRILLANADAQIGELSQLVDDLLRLAHTRETDAPALVRTAFHEAATRAVARARRRGPGLEFTTEIEPCYVLADPGGLERAVLNLLDNAVKFSPPGGRVTLRLRGGECVIEDEGPGIAPQDLPRVFDRFFRSDSARALPGSGLGLAIVAQYAARVGGEVTLAARPPDARPAHPTAAIVRSGTIARLKVPLAPSGAAATRQPAHV